MIEHSEHHHTHDLLDRLLMLWGLRRSSQQYVARNIRAWQADVEEAEAAANSVIRALQALRVRHD